MMHRILNILGVESYRVSHTERLVSLLGAFTGILAIFLISTFSLGEDNAAIIIASMGASAVLLFAVPHGTLSQPWPLVGGHLISAAIGVTCAKYISNLYIAGPLAVGLAVGAMHYLRCIHPPGGATALAATVGGPGVAALGYQFIATPVLLNVTAILITAIVFNYFFAWRRYPVYLVRSKRISESRKTDMAETIAHEDFVYALSEIDSFIDVTEDDLLTIYNLVTQSREGKHLDPAALELGRCYSNGQYGELWSVRQIVDWGEAAGPGNRQIIYKVVAGADRRTSGVVSAQEFSRWGKYEVYRDEENWRRV
jgi:CBS domain-containing membrane protein